MSAIEFGSADFVERHRFRLDPMHPRLGLGEQGEDPDRVPGDGRGQGSRLQPQPYVPPRRVVMVTPVIMLLLVQPVLVRCLDVEADAAQHVVAVAQRPAAHAGDPRRRLDGARFVLGAGIEQRRGEHVARDAADRIEVDMLHPGAAPGTRSHDYGPNREDYAPQRARPFSIRREPGAAPATC